MVVKAGNLFFQAPAGLEDEWTLAVSSAFDGDRIFWLRDHENENIGAGLTEVFLANKLQNF